ncbi:MAG: GNAT family N-acetyltransferase [bacterium]|nr:GNAT family N-acetyltransferase [bacterium]
MRTRQYTLQDHPGIIAVADALPEWFDQDARTRAIPLDLRHQEGFVAIVDGIVVGFITLYVFEGRLQIGWLGVKPEYRGQGVGSLLLSRSEEFGRKHDLEEIATYTVGEGVDYAPYAATREFYYRRGFTVYQRNRTDNPGCLEEIKIRKRIANRER